MTFSIPDISGPVVGCILSFAFLLFLCRSFIWHVTKITLVNLQERWFAALILATIGVFCYSLLCIPEDDHLESTIIALKLVLCIIIVSLELLVCFAPDPPDTGGMG